jgi:hypothetical protein
MSYGIRCADTRTVTLEMIMDNPADVGPFVIDPTRSLTGYSWLVRGVFGDTPRGVRDC